MILFIVSQFSKVPHSYSVKDDWDPLHPPDNHLPPFPPQKKNPSTPHEARWSAAIGSFWRAFIGTFQSSSLFWQVDVVTSKVRQTIGHLFINNQMDFLNKKVFQFSKSYAVVSAEDGYSSELVSDLNL